MSRRFTPSPGYKLFLVRLVEARTDRGLTIEELADRLGLPTNLVAAYENGEKPLDFVQTRTWCLALDVPFTEFVLSVESDMEANLLFDEPVVGHQPKDTESGTEPESADPYGVAHFVLPHVPDSLPHMEGDDAEGTAKGDDLFDDFDALEKR